MLGHQESLWPLTAALGLTRAAKLPFSGAYFFEFFSYEGEDYIAVKFRDDKGFVHKIKLSCSLGDSYLDEDHQGACSANSFMKFIEARLDWANKVQCDQEYPFGQVSYADTDAYTSQLLKDIGLE